MSRVGADVLERASIAVVGVDAADLSTVVSCGALDIDVALALARALFQKEKEKVSNWSQLRYSSRNRGPQRGSYVSTRPVDFSIILGVEVDDLLHC